MSARSPVPYRALLAIGLVMAIALALVSVHLRLVNSGLGCAEWPQCYGRIGAALEDVAASDGWTKHAKLTHRILASGLGIVVLLAFLAAMRQKRSMIAAVALLLVTLALAALGRHSAGLEIPAVVMANFSGGILLAALFWWMLIRANLRWVAGPQSRSRWAWVTILALSVQMLSGGLVSAYFAGLACGPSIGCDGHWLPEIPWTALGGLFDSLALDDTGKVVTGQSLTGLHMGHRIGGVATVAILSWLAWSAHKARRTGLACTMLALAAVTASSGVLTVRTGLPPGLVLAHYGAALALLLATLTAAAGWLHGVTHTRRTASGSGS